jgi:hypothetical protein
MDVWSFYLLSQKNLFSHSLSNNKHKSPHPATQTNLGVVDYQCVFTVFSKTEWLIWSE